MSLKSKNPSQNNFAILKRYVENTQSKCGTVFGQRLAFKSGGWAQIWPPGNVKNNKTRKEENCVCVSGG